ncbi:MAG: DUF2007 domain-containing protein [Ghiorsea sp.]|nr:DUF2007 domain-containing protein [Ghiorsea sp.]
MKCVFEADQLGEAYIIKHLLERASLHPIIHGEYLQGGVGEIAPSGLLKIVVAIDEYDEAKSIIQAWDEAEWDEDAWRHEAQ